MNQGRDDGAADDPARDARVFSELIRHLYRRAVPANTMVAIAALLLAALLRDSLPGLPLVLATAFLFLSALLRLELYRRYRRDSNHVPVASLARRYTVSTLTAGLAWASLCALLIWSGDIILLGVAYLLGIGVVAGAVGVLYPHLPAMMAYVLPCTIGLGIGLFMRVDLIGVVMGTAILAYALFNIGTARVMNAGLAESLSLQFQNLSLIEQLQAEVEQRKIAQRALEVHQEQLEGIVDERTAQLRDTNRSLELEVAERKQAEQTLKYMAHHDVLTDLPNRLLLDARLDHSLNGAQRASEQVAVLFLDLDRFKNVNDSLGHAVGDELLRQVGLRLREAVREGDTVARLGGDEFVVVMEGLRDAKPAEELALKLMRVLSDRFAIQSHQLFVETSIGISLFPRDGSSATELVSNADAAMYRAKERGRNSFAFYETEMTEQAFRRVSLETRLRDALDRGDLEVWYQPQVDLADGQIRDVEALLRWRDGEMGMLEPPSFLGVAEESGLIVPIGAWVLDTACQQIRGWRDADLPVQRVSVNLSGMQMRREGLVETVRQTLQRSTCEPGWLELEITESYIMPDMVFTPQALAELRGMGVGIAIDDFGTGYSSMAQLKALTIDKLKIDRGFVRGLHEDADDEAIVRAILALAHSLRLRVVAEGVENRDQERFLSNEGCDSVQGFLHARPMPAADMEAFLRQHAE